MKIKRIIALILSLLLVLSVFPMSVYADDECSHRYTMSVSAVKPTCGDKGNIAYRFCLDCDDYYVDSKGNRISKDDTGLPPTGIHTYKDGVCSVCGANDVHEHKGGTATCCSIAVCSECGASYGDYDKNNHESDDVNLINDIDSTCTSEGYTGDTYHKCCNALKSYGEVIAVKDHSESTRIENEVAPTCGENGSYDLVTYCTVCKSDVNRETVTVPLTAEHNYIIEVDSSRVEPTCSSKGSVIMKCLCGAEKVYEIEADSNAHSWSEWTEIKKVTCTENGMIKRVCAHNTTHFETKEIITEGHNTVKHEANEASCISEGNVEYWECKTCSKLYSDAECTVEIFNVTTNKKDHSFTRYTSDNNATCVQDGTMTAVCDSCKTETDTKTEVGSKDFASHKPDANGTVCLLCDKVLAVVHTWSETEVEIKKATCTEDGAMAIVCIDCGEIKEGTKTVITASGHNYTEEWNEIMSANCQQNGIKIKICKNCYDVITEVIPKTQHIDSDGNGICESCGYNNNPVAPSPAPEAPVEPSPEVYPITPPVTENETTDTTKDCSCGCHKDGIAGFFFDFMNFFYKIFGVNRVCSCGASH